jgi:hypothetical protein
MSRIGEHQCGKSIIFLSSCVLDKDWFAGNSAAWIDSDKLGDAVLDSIYCFFQSWSFENTLTVGALLIAGFSWWSARGAAISSAKSASVAERQLDILTRRVKMIDEPGKMAEVLPAWFVERMSMDSWSFGLIMDNGVVFPIRSITKISDDGQWLEVELMEQGDNIHMFPDSPVADMRLIYGLGRRLTANIQVSKIVGAMDLANT